MSTPAPDLYAAPEQVRLEAVEEYYDWSDGLLLKEILGSLVIVTAVSVIGFSTSTGRRAPGDWGLLGALLAPVWYLLIAGFLTAAGSLIPAVIIKAAKDRSFLLSFRQCFVVIYALIFIVWTAFQMFVFIFSSNR